MVCVSCEELVMMLPFQTNTGLLMFAVDIISIVSLYGFSVNVGAIPMTFCVVIG